MGSFISLTASDGHSFDVYEAKAVGDLRGGLVLLQEIFGVTEHIQDLCEKFARDGFHVLSPAVYDRRGKNLIYGYDENAVKAAVDLRNDIGLDAPMLDIQACVDALKGDGPGNLPVHITGFCWGGSLVWCAAAKVTGLSSAVSYYGAMVHANNDLNPNVPVMLHFGSRDRSIPMEHVVEIGEAHPDVKVHIYRAEHGFCSDRPAHYDKDASDTAYARTIDFFLKNS